MLAGGQSLVPLINFRLARPTYRECPDSSDAQIREAISGNLCRGTGYRNIVAAARAAARSVATATSR